MDKLSKAARVVLALTMVVAIFLVSGCGEEAKYNQLKNSFVKEMKVYDKMYSGSTSDFQAIAVKEKEMDKALADMYEITAKEIKLNNDRILLEREWNWKKEMTANRIAETRAIKKMQRETKRRMTF